MGRLPHSKIQDEDSKNLQKKSLEVCDQVKDNILNLQLSDAVYDVMKLLDRANQYLEKKAPWKLVQTDKEQTALVLYTCMEVVRISAGLLYPAMPESCLKILNRLQIFDFHFEKIKSWEVLKENLVIRKEAPLFPRLQQ